MLRREARLRKEYLYRKAEQERAQKDAIQGRVVQEAVTLNRAIPSELQQEGVSYARTMLFDNGLLDVTDEIDSEYSTFGVKPPKVLITTSRDPSSRLQQFAKEIRLMFPNGQRINRGGHVIEDLVKVSRTSGVTDLVVLHEHRGVPDGLIVSHFPHGPTAYFSLHNVVLRHEVEEASNHKMSEAYPHLIFSNLNSKLGKRVQKILTSLFPEPKADSARVLSFVNENDFISFRHHVFKCNAKEDHEAEITEVGPRFELRLYQIKLGTLDVMDADVEWAYKPYMNTSRKKLNL